MECPTCAVNTFVVDTRETSKNGLGAVRRIRQCKACGTRFTTMELVVEGSIGKRQSLSKRQVAHHDYRLTKVKAHIHGTLQRNKATRTS